eukprot:g2288.t1
MERQMHNALNMWLLKSVCLGNESDKQLANALRKCEVLHFKPGATVFQKDDELASVYIVIHGVFEPDSFKPARKTEVRGNLVNATVVSFGMEWSQSEGPVSAPYTLRAESAGALLSVPLQVVNPM